MKEKMRQYPLFIVLVPVFYLLHLLNDYYHLLSFPDLFVKETYWYIVIPAILFAVCIAKKLRGSAITILYLEIIFFFFAALQSFLKAHVNILGSYTVLLSLIAIIFILLTIIVWTGKTAFHRVYFYFNSLLLMLVCYELLFLFLMHTSNGKVKGWFTQKQLLTRQYPPCKDCPKPDIFFIIFDGYAGAASLRSQWQYDNAALDSFFTNKGFFYAAHSRSNYNVTPYSVGSILNMDYHKDLQIKKLYTREFMEGVHTVSDNQICDILTQQGYRILNYSIFNMSYDKTRVDAFRVVNKRELIVYQTFWDRFSHDVGWKFGIKISPDDEYTVQQELLKENRIQLKRIDQAYKGVTGISSNIPVEPFFMYAHFVLPHDPYFYDSTGRLYPENEWADSRKNGGKYLAQLVYTNTIIKKLVNQLLLDAARPRIIIIQSDHGYRSYEDSLPKSLQFNNLSAIYFPDKKYDKLYDSISSVNTFRVILNKYFNMPVPLLKDTSVYIPW